jgi:hypothetical protein
MRARAKFGWMDFNRRCVVPAARPAVTRGMLIPVLAAIAVSQLGMTEAPAQDTASLRLCAARDVEAVTLIEDHGEANDIAPEELAKAALTRWTRVSPAPAAARRREWRFTMISSARSAQCYPGANDALRHEQA